MLEFFYSIRLYNEVGILELSLRLMLKLGLKLELKRSLGLEIKLGISVNL